MHYPVIRGFWNRKNMIKLATRIACSVFIVVLCCVVGSSIVVSSFEELEELYDARKNNNENDPIFILNDAAKEKQCKDVLNSQYFKSSVINEEYVDKNDPAVFAAVSGDQKLVSLHYQVTPGKLWKSSKFKPIYPYRELSVNFPKVKKTYTQAMFPCLAKKKFSGILVTYFISYAYFGGQRFLFGHSFHGLRLLALIEPRPWSGIFKKPGKLESFYLERKKDAENKLLRPPDPVCSLKNYEKMRLCLLVFDSDVYVQANVKFMGNPGAVQYNCVAKEVCFKNSSPALFENMVLCRTIVNSNSVLYGISQGFSDANSGFVFKCESEQFCLLDSFLKYLSVLEEQKPIELEQSSYFSGSKLFSFFPELARRFRRILGI